MDWGYLWRGGGQEVSKKYFIEISWIASALNGTEQLAVCLKMAFVFIYLYAFESFVWSFIYL